ncbi:MAG TPA: CapA family protein, partial [Candidatus Dojkabacteria bacterium]|nr:CapA family protein [Candidatus Dojkabacteria bacterium]
KSTIETYKAKGWDYFGGGVDITDANKILIKQVNGNKIAFLGYNYYDTALGSGEIATATHAGSTPFNWAKIKSDIASAKKQGAIVFVDVQYQECYSYPPDGGLYPPCYRPIAAPDQKTDFRKIIDLGADVVIGTQAHQPQTYEIYKGKIIYYGLGNLYFDQIVWIGTRQGLIITQYVYDGKLIQSRIVTTFYDGDMRPYITTDNKRTSFLNLLKAARPVN